MRRTLVSCLLLVVLIAAGTSGPATAVPRVVLIGVDGATWNVIDPLVASGEMPHLAALMQRGVHANLATVEPVNSPTVWTAMATGQPPEVNGIASFIVDERDVQSPRVFEWLAHQGLRVGLYQYLVTWPPRPLPNGFVVPGWLSGGPQTAPASLADVFRYDIADIRSRERFHDHSFEELARKPAAFLDLAKRFDLDVGAVSFYALDNLSHRFWADSFPADFDAETRALLEPQYADAVRNGYRAFDRALGEIVAGLPEDTALVLVSDHGFQAHGSPQRRYKFYLEDRLTEAVPPGDDYELQGEFGFIINRVFEGPFAEREAAAQRVEAFLEAISTEAGEQVLWVQPIDIAPRPDGHERGFVEWAKQQALTLLGRFFGTGLDRNAHGYVIGVPLPALDAVWPDGQLRIGGQLVPARELLYADSFTGDHLETAVFAAAGPGIRGREARGALSVLDVAPLITWLAHADVPAGLAGTLPVALLDTDEAEARPLREVPADRWPRYPVSLPDLEGADLDGRLRALGYIE